jgi:endoglucanase
MQFTSRKKIIIIFVLLSGSILFLSGFTFLFKKDTFDFLKNKISDVSKNSSSKESVYFQTYPTVVLQDLWIDYKRHYIQNDGRTVDKSSNLVTTSEGQSYSLLRAVWSDDKETFDRVWKWTNVNLKKRGEDNLFAWKWGKSQKSGNWEILVEEGGLNTASDADQDIALALILAHYRWNDQYYLDQSRRILNDIWTAEVVIMEDKPYLTAGNWASKKDEVTINPSYYSFAAYEVFQDIDPVHDWKGVKETSYQVLNSFSDTLPPDWAVIKTGTMQIQPVGLNGREIMFSHDALRIPWRVALDWKWNKDERAKNYLTTKLDLFNTEWERYGSIREAYSLNGEPKVSTDNLSMYGSLLPYMQITNPKIAEELFQAKIATQFNPDTGSWNKDLGYYDSNWTWFGLALFLDYTTDVNSIKSATKQNLQNQNSQNITINHFLTNYKSNN